MSTTLQSNTFQLNDQIQWQDAGPGMQRQVYGYDDHLMLVKVKFERGLLGFYISTINHRRVMLKAEFLN